MQRKYKRKKIFLRTQIHFLIEENAFLDAFENGIFPIKIESTSFPDLNTRDKVSEHFNLKILTIK